MEGMLWLSLFGCELLQPYLEEVREETTEVAYGGWISAGPVGSDTEMLVDGTVEFWGVDGELLSEAEQPFADSPGYWRVVLPPDTPFNLRIESEEAYPAVWRGRSPNESGIWLTGALFSWPHSAVDPFFEALEESLAIEVADLKTEDVVHVWGQVTNREDADASDWPIRDGEGRRVEPYTFRQQEDGSLVLVEEAPVDYVFAFNLAPGAVEVAGVIYDSQAGDLLAPWWFEVLP